MKIIVPEGTRIVPPGQDESVVESSTQTLDPGVLETWMFLTTITGSVLVISATIGLFQCKNLLIYWGQEASVLVKEYLQKMAIYNVLIVILLYVIYEVIFNQYTAGVNGIECLEIGQHKLLVLSLVAGSLIAGLIRYLAVGFGHSESYSFAGNSIKNRQVEYVRQGFNVNTNVIYAKLIPAYLKMSVIVLSLATLILFAPISEQLTSPVLKQSICLVGWPITEDGSFDKRRLLSFGLLIFLPVLTIVFLEHLCHVRTKGVFTKVPGYYTVLNAPFVMVAMTTTWSMWLCIFLVTLYTFGLGSGEYFSMLTLMYTFLDSLWLCFICIVVGRKNRK